LILFWEKESIDSGHIIRASFHIDIPWPIQYHWSLPIGFQAVVLKKENEAASMTRDEIKTNILRIFETEFEISHPGLDDNLTEEHDFDSIDALELLGEIEKMLGSELTRQEKLDSMEIRTINQICDYVVSLAQIRALM